MFRNKISKNIFFLIILFGLGSIYSPVRAQETSEEEVLTEYQEIQPEPQDNEEYQPPVSEEDDFPQSLPEYTWSDFAVNKDCRPFIKALATHPEYNSFYQNLKVVCLADKPSSWKDLLNAFRREKRQLLISQTLNKTISYTKYLKVIPYLLFDIQNTAPIGNTPMAILDKTEQAIVDHQIDNVLPLIDELPEIWQNGLKNTQFLTKRLLELKDQFNTLNDNEQEVQND